MDRLNSLAFTRDRRRRLRNLPTYGEAILWHLLKGKGLGVKFRRQAGIGRYIADFYCTEKKLVIELDGPTHHTPHGKEYDARRDKFLNDQGIRVLRFTNEQCDAHYGDVILAIKSALQ
jgi:very-short-patch-repair endonuclease